MTTLTSLYADFSKAFTNALDNIVNASRVYADAIKEHGDKARKGFVEKFPKITSAMFRRFEAVGTDRMDVRLVLASSYGANSLRSLPIAEQRKALDSGVSVLVDGKPTTIAVDGGLSQTQVRQVFAFDHIRTIAEQKAWLDANNGPISVTVKSRSLWRVCEGKIVVSRACTLTKTDIQRMLKELA